ncbi:hypothetical protein B0H19DRAFT_1236333 [Mycena capillaripes]|nr:hypothetical protein B0H19DRAFT_1236333 [Mycena capillaripes]
MLHAPHAEMRAAPTLASSKNVVGTVRGRFRWVQREAGTESGLARRRPSCDASGESTEGRWLVGGETHLPPRGLPPVDGGLALTTGKRGQPLNRTGSVCEIEVKTKRRFPRTWLMALYRLRTSPDSVLVNKNGASVGPASTVEIVEADSPVKPLNSPWVYDSGHSSDMSDGLSGIRTRVAAPPASAKSAPRMLAPRWKTARGDRNLEWNAR